MFANTTDDEDTFLVASNNLASLFGVSNITDDTASLTNAALTYTAPKQPTSKIVEPTRPNKHQSSLILFKEVHAFKLIDKNYINLGRCGFAFIGNDSIPMFQLLLYKQKNDIISCIKFSSEFIFYEKDDNYASFSDDQKVNWTVHFTSELDLSEFSQAIKSRGGRIIKNSDKKNISPLTKNISTLTKDAGTATQKPNQTKSPEFCEEFINKIDSDLSDSSSNNNTKASILSRMAKMGQKLLPNSNLSDGTDSDTAEKERRVPVPNRKMKRGSSISSPVAVAVSVPDAPQNNKSTSCKTLPLIASVPQAYTIVNGQYVPIVQSQYMSSIHNNIPMENLPSPVMYTHQAPTQIPIAPINQQLSFEQLQMYFTENRTHNSEVRMNILRLTTKMEEVLDKMQTNETSKKTENIEESTSEKYTLLHEENVKLKIIVEKLQKQIERYKGLEQKQTELLEKQIPILKSNQEMDKIISTHIETDKKHLEKIEELESTIRKQAEALRQYENDRKSFAIKEKIDIDETIKKLMNSLYNDINGQIPDDESMYGRDIKKTLAQKIVDNAYNIIAVVNDTSKREKSEVE